MSAEVIYGRELANDLRERMRQEVSQLSEQGVHPNLTVIIVGEDPASLSYVRGKERASQKIGMQSNLMELPESTSHQELLNLVDSLNHDQEVHGILVQLPLPSHINEDEVIEAISPGKDVDGFHPINIGRMMAGKETFLPCTPLGILTMLDEKGIEIEGKHAVVLGRSRIVGKPIGQMLLNRNATVTYCHSKTKQVADILRQADILIVAVGKPSFIQADQIKEGAVVIDVGVNRLEDGTLTGDVDFESALEKASYLTPVPRGVGPMTITMLLHNTIKAAKQIHNVE
ncbi:bifunctional methylenetetrahydrofolate dehydrogenase/methenyltetrahydrofolate cyclohydrolase FolD [Pontibacillus yanchengensis]|uniref:Bifunctional protein FolD n=2 Tax=Pontibacillus yanchengensis TaxID=462910 RepID=A0A6I4ZWP6_9BACI|nr:bifunctional methylenetetrahydrofolate dehydrogenase/methenyltetrahydrofolate cyclohydrolase FolD [Pontibacillus yanchengensis]MYL33524.1 bifunctional methylenetetrahydrofolate dehydrogenase/methenyltetrahydrofolate cyclohydrolase FolD [Pontibacillus yanchengensis]MYL53574.1 bifunctional methylenetetrahydrofolate dehydrogenase/methenyltetrahydrofolate cyclohydrolase FolD [Pontibacillus yanchengensis]